MTSSTEAIEGYFETYGWQYESASPGLYRTGFAGDSGQYDIWVRVTDQWVYFAISPFLKPATDEGHLQQVLETLLLANHEINMAKFAVDEAGDVILSVELPIEGFGYSHFSDALTALSHYADDFREKFEMAQQADHAEVV